MTVSSTTKPLRPNDHFKLEDLPADILEGIDFWAKNTPQEPALKIPRGNSVSDGFETVSFAELKTLRDRAASWLASKLGLSTPANMDAPAAERTVVFLISPTHEALVPWMALAALGYTCQFISPVHQPEVVAELIAKSSAQSIIHSDMEPNWLSQVFSLTRTSSDGHPPVMLGLTAEDELLVQLALVRKGEATSLVPAALHQVKPEPFVILHSFGSTSTPKLYPLPLVAANMSAHDSAWWALISPFEKRWRCQLQTSLPFHFSFQNPVWRALKCGTTLAFPLINPSTKQHRAQLLVPDAEDTLNSIWLADADILYCSPQGLQNMLETSVKPESPKEWRKAVEKLNQAHTGAAPVSEEKAECYERHGLLVFQVFATTEAGLLFFARKDVTGHTTWLKPLPPRKEHMLFRKQPNSDVHELWLKDSFPGLLNQSVSFEPYPENPAIKAWNTSDTFRLLPAFGPHDDLVSFAGRQDDWIRCTHGTAARALEIEEQLTKDLRDDLGFEAVRGVTVIGNGKAGLGAVIELDKEEASPMTKEEEAALLKSTTYINDKLLHYPSVLHPSNCIVTDASRPIRMTQKGSIQRALNEQTFGPELERRLSA